MYLDLVLFLHSLSTEAKIITMQLYFLLLEIVYFFWLRKHFEEEEKKIKEMYLLK